MAYYDRQRSPRLQSAVTDQRITIETYDCSPLGNLHEFGISSSSSSDIYSVKISKFISCTCQDYKFRRGVRCKHILKALIFGVGVSEDDAEIVSAESALMMLNLKRVKVVGVERTFMLIKPDGLHRGLVARRLSYFSYRVLCFVFYFFFKTLSLGFNERLRKIKRPGRRCFLTRPGWNNHSAA